MINCPILRFSHVAYDKFLKWEKYIFLFFLLITLLQLWLTKYVPSLDGPQHLYNATVLANLIKGNDLFREFFTFNSTITGYWTAHALLGFFTSFLPAWLAEKLFLSAYVLGVIWAFRYLVHSINPGKGNFVIYLIFPFVYHSFFLMGYYAFSFGLIFFFLAFGYFIRHIEQFGSKQFILFGLILLGLFLTHGLIYLFFVLSFLVYYMGTSLHQILSPELSWHWKDWLTKTFKVLVSFTPSLMLWLVYILRVMSLDDTVSGASFSFRELLDFLLRIRQLVGFHHELEAIGYVPLFILIFILSIVTIVLFISRLKDNSARLHELLNRKHIWAVVGALFLGLYFFAPDRISAGSLTNRFGLYFFFMIILWLALQKIPKTFQVLTLVIVLFSVSYTRITHHRFYRNLNKDIAEITELTKYMEADKVVDYRLNSTNWVHVHFQLYAAVEKPLVHLRNVQCWGQFPMLWNYETLPRCYAGDKRVKPSGSITVGDDKAARQIDYITIFRKDKFEADTSEADWHKVLDKYYEERHTSKRGNAVLYGKIPD